MVLAVSVTVGLTSPGLLPQAHAASPTILVLGDSLSAGYGINVKEGWVALLTERLQQEKFPHRVINASISGETTAGGKARLPKLLAEHQPGIVILELGANDGLRGLPVAQMQRNLAEMIAASQARGAQVVLLGMQMPNNYGANYTRSFADAYAQLAKPTTQKATQQSKVHWLPFFLDGVAQHPELMQADSLHPNEAAQPRLLRNVWAVLKPAL